MDRTERQKLGIKRWLEAGAIGTLEYGTGVGIRITKSRSLKEWEKFIGQNR